MFHRLKPEPDPAPPRSYAPSKNNPAESLRNDAQDNLALEVEHAQLHVSNDQSRNDGQYYQPRETEKSFAPPPPETQPHTARQNAPNQNISNPQITQQKETAAMNDQSQSRKSAETNSKQADANASNARALEGPGGPGGIYQRTGQAAGWNATNYPAHYAANNAPSLRDVPSAVTENKLTIGRGITMSGEIKSCNYLVVEGTVEAVLSGASVLEVAESGMFFGAVEIEEATIAGRFEGELTVNGRLIVRSTGSIKGTVHYKELEVEAGAVIDGRLTPASAQQEGRKPRGKDNAARRDQPSRLAKDAQGGAANQEGELFSGGAAAAE